MNHPLSPPFPPPLADDAGDAAQVERAAEDARRERARVLADLARVMESPAGRRVVWRILEAAHCFRSSFAATAHETAFREGERAVGLRLWDDALAAAPERLAETVRENGGGGLAVPLRKRE